MQTCFPSKQSFVQLAKKGNLIPVYAEVLADLETPVSCFLKMGERPYAYLLESVEGGERMARYSFLGASPSILFESRGRHIKIVTKKTNQTRTFLTNQDPLNELEKILNKFKYVDVEGLPPFSGGAVGYMGYDMVRFIERISDKNPDRLHIPDSLFIFTDTLYIFDHIGKKIKFVCNVFLEDFRSASEAYDYAVERITQEIRKLRCSIAQKDTLGESFSQKKIHIKSNVTKERFKKMVEKAKAYIRSGDIIQVVASQSFHTPIQSASFDIYRSLRSINPSPYMFYLNCGDFQLVGSSPEIHVRYENGKAGLRPIAGTRPRGATPEEDRMLEKELLADPKEKAEHLMLVDLGRNDLGRVCQYNSVRVSEFMTVERYSHVMHLVSTVEGVLKKGKNCFDLLRATFPAGTVTGAPKVRAMEIIDELENQKRGFYSGVVGYFSYSKNLDSCITIRTILVKDHKAHIQAGAGIVADSKPDKEYEETVNKAKALLKAIAFAENAESQRRGQKL